MRRRNQFHDSGTRTGQSWDQLNRLETDGRHEGDSRHEPEEIGKAKFAIPLARFCHSRSVVIRRTSREMRVQNSFTGRYRGVMVVLRIVVKVQKSVHSRSRQQDDEHSNHGQAPKHQNKVTKCHNDCQPRGFVSPFLCRQAPQPPPKDNRLRLTPTQGRPQTTRPTLCCATPLGAPSEPLRGGRQEL